MTDKQYIPKDMFDAALSMWNVVYTQYKLGEKYQEWHASGLENVTIDHITRHLPLDVKIPICRLYDMLHKYHPAE